MIISNVTHSWVLCEYKKSSLSWKIYISVWKNLILFSAADMFCLGAIFLLSVITSWTCGGMACRAGKLGVQKCICIPWKNFVSLVKKKWNVLGVDLLDFVGRGEKRNILLIAKIDSFLFSEHFSRKVKSGFPLIKYLFFFISFYNSIAKWMTFLKKSE